MCEKVEKERKESPGLNKAQAGKQVASEVVKPTWWDEIRNACWRRRGSDRLKRAMLSFTITALPMTSVKFITLYH